ncbi:MAG TPA: O-antigen ligase family protein [Acidimicrobiia bacterium]
MLDSRASSGDGPAPIDRPSANATRRVPLVLLALFALVALAIGFAVGTGPELSSTQLFLGAGVVGGVAFALVAVNRFWWLILVLFAVRASLDALKPAEGGGGGLEAGTIVGVVFLVTASVWLFVQWRSDQLAPISVAGTSFLALGAAYLLSTPGAVAPFASVQSAMKVVAVAVMYVVLEQIFVRAPERIVSLLAATLASLIVPAIVALSQVGRSPDQETVPGLVDISRLQGTFVHPNMFAAYLVVVGLLAFALVPHLPRWRSLLIVVIILVVPLLIMTYARGAWIGFYVGLLFIGLAQSRVLLIGIFTATIVIALAVPSVTDRLSDLDIAKSGHAPKTDQPRQIDANSAEWRVDYWREVLPMFEDSPVTGIGTDMIRRSTPEHAPAHSAFIDTIVETGVAGALTLLAVAISVLLGIRRAGRRLRDGPARGLVVGAGAIGLALLVQFFSESLMTQPAILWYAVGPIAWAVAAGRAPAPAVGGDRGAARRSGESADPGAVEPADAFAAVV